MSRNRYKRAGADNQLIKQCTYDVRVLEEDIVDISEVLKMAGNTTRLKILFLIYQEEKMCPTDIGQILEMTVPAVSQQLKKLKASGILYDEQVGQTIYYSINENRGRVLVPILNRLIALNY